MSVHLVYGTHTPGGIMTEESLLLKSLLLKKYEAVPFSTIMFRRLFFVHLTIPRLAKINHCEKPDAARARPTVIPFPPSITDRDPVPRCGQGINEQFHTLRTEPSDQKVDGQD
jgi:hypothetical protein